MPEPQHTNCGCRPDAKHNVPWFHLHSELKCFCPHLFPRQTQQTPRTIHSESSCVPWQQADLPEHHNTGKWHRIAHYECTHDTIMLEVRVRALIILTLNIRTDHPGRGSVVKLRTDQSGGPTLRMNEFKRQTLDTMRGGL